MIVLVSIFAVTRYSDVQRPDALYRLDSGDVLFEQPEPDNWHLQTFINSHSVEVNQPTKDESKINYAWAVSFSIVSTFPSAAAF